MNDSRSPNRRWYHLTPARLVMGLLVVEGFLLLSERFGWFPFNERKGWTVLIGVAAVCLGVLLLLFWFALSLLFRIRFQFSLQSLLVFIMVCAILCGWCAVKMEQARKQKEAVEVIRKAGGGVLRYYEGTTWRTARKPNPPVPAWLLKLLGNDFFCDVSVTFLGRKLSDQDAAHLGRLSSLTDLDLSSTQITGVGLEHLKRLTNLRVLILNNTEVSDAGLEHLKGLTNLQWLELSNNQVTDVGLEHLPALTSLELLHLQGTQVTDEGVKKLQQALPNCKIYH